MSSEIGVRLSGDNSEFKSMLADSTEQSIEWGGKLTEKIGDKLLGLRDVSHAVATALGLNLEKVAENLARAFTGISEEAEKLYKEIEARNDQTTEKNIANNQKLLSAQQKYTQALQDQETFTKRIAELEAEKGQVVDKWNGLNYSWIVKLMNSRKESTEIAAKENEISKEQAKLAEANAIVMDHVVDTKKEVKSVDTEIAAAERSRADAAIKSADALLPLTERRNALEEQLQGLEQATGHEMLQNKKSVEDINRLKEVENQLADVNKQITEETRKGAEAIEKANFANLTDEQKRQSLLALIQTQSEAIKNIEEEGKDAGAVKNQQELTRSELTKLNLDIAKKDTEEKKKQTAETDKYLMMTREALTAEANRIELAIQEANALGLQTDELTRQLDLINKIIAGKQASLTISGSEDVKSETTDALMGNLRRVQEQLNAQSSSGFGQIKDATANGNYGDFLSKSLLTAQAGAIQGELNLRSNVQDYATRYGQSAATQTFGDQVTQRALQNMTDVQTQTLQKLTTISQQLNNSGIFPHPNV